MLHSTETSTSFIKQAGYIYISLTNLSPSLTVHQIKKIWLTSNRKHFCHCLIHCFSPSRTGDRGFLKWSSCDAWEDTATSINSLENQTDSILQLFGSVSLRVYNSVIREKSCQLPGTKRWNEPVDSPKGKFPTKIDLVWSCWKHKNRKDLCINKNKTFG